MMEVNSILDAFVCSFVQFNNYMLCNAYRILNKLRLSNYIFNINNERIKNLLNAQQIKFKNQIIKISI